MLDGLSVILAQPAQYDDDIISLFEQQLRDDFIGAAEIHQPHRRKVEESGAALESGDSLPDTGAHRTSGGPGNEIGIGSVDRFPQHAVHPDGMHHVVGAPSFAGITIWSCAPGNDGSDSVIRTSSSQGGTMAIRAVP